MTAQLNWDDLRVFLAIAEKGGLAGAARALGVNHSTVFRRLNDFETRIGVRLFERLPSGYAPTAAGEDMKAVATRMAAEVEGLDRRLGGRDVRLTGTLRVTAPDTIAAGVMGPPLKAFADAYPGIAVEFDMSNATFNLSKREADVAVRPTRNPPANLVGRRLCKIAFAAYAGKAYLKQAAKRAKGGAPDLAALDWLAPDDTQAHLPSYRWLAREIPNARVALRATSYLALAAAAAAGQGAVHLPCFMGDADPKLVRLAPPESSLASELWLLTHEDLRQTARVRAFMEFMADALLQEKALLEGDRPR